MNEKEVMKTLNQIKKQLKEKHSDKSDEEIDEMMLDAFFKAYCDNQMSREDLMALTIVMGYEVNEEVLDQVEKEKQEHSNNDERRD